ncbi:MAG: YigZ family protein [Gammaproteobacteria bacterium]|jgi:uncharacterized YigZ family protein
MSDSLQVPAQTIEREIEIRKSRFIARAGRVTSRDQARAFLEQARADYPDARHHCWAYLLGNPSATASAAMNDDGEPSGTAGKPILNVIQHKGIGNVMVVVVRYFGGVKLGAGGLVRAYAGATEAALSELPLEVHRPTSRVRLVLDFALEQAVRHWADGRDAEIVSVDYGEQVVMTLVVRDGLLAELDAFCRARGVVSANHPA